ncbi:U32 family peptidase [Clostridium sp. SHJSY1]|uniref:peptidase U32 family protein n=1 Tax=Clostridium sp. SHJSY1 TaxID=2942483 RepID=UPI002876CF95|nr:U32 family peptidase [Clostridium sp. SHJSY1]MDS0527090.1 U32 family peptidase [Clostridium sp. SHJSY1]
MNIMCPVNSVHALKSYIGLGIEEIYVGVDCEEFGLNNVTFTGRTKLLCNGENAQLKDFKELKEVIEICHANGILVNFTANVRNLPEELTQEYLNYVDKAVKAGVDTIIVGSILALIILKGRYDIPVHSSTFFYPFNKYNVDFFHELGVKRMILPTALSLAEIKEITEYINKKNYDMEIEVFGHFGCTNINGRCNIFHNPPSICRGKFLVTDSKNNTQTDCSFLDAGKDCTICSIIELEKLGIKSIKIMGRGLPIPLIGTLVSVYKTATTMVKEGYNTKEIRKAIIEKAPWWQNSYCRDERCMYRETQISNYYV